MCKKAIVETARSYGGAPFNEAHLWEYMGQYEVELTREGLLAMSTTLKAALSDGFIVPTGKTSESSIPGDPRRSLVEYKLGPEGGDPTD